MSSINITTTDEYIIMRIPKNSPEGRKLSGKREITEDEALKIFTQAKKDYKTGKLEEIQDLSQLL
ncbi:hypothetical protein A3C59_00885 [Candidatus Daviesbacteria bacterium RIFCSPHIGHO2_02_FULL_36_13]|uniref:Uncharacterized protein n=1 Tax=Candidatus Daviesbacteria bacterium RIFCSPHIGHO2_02_FULL_36_13 TaxID=1797768 RepID=A0A1F5JRN6_9BACT|nr:MAG: hypothetical protein A3C59_00885 [Candidatus Daviesbacteria bacterium RIFCSPHIGHO2_02_FULL_36_13]OGE44180.1 MAG: hypothetical protein A3A45_01830 [Candidatus Daviesbacteria bacterium RIFCSPLOWO2_01_FULL_36_8]